MTKEEIEMQLTEKLKTALAGKEYNSWNIDSQILSIVRSTVSPSIAQQLWSVKDGRSNIISITYDRSTLAEITVKKTRGKKHYNVFGSYCDWTVGEITVNLWHNSFEDGIAEHDAWTMKMHSKEYQHKQDLAEKAKLIMETLNLPDTGSMFSLVEELKKYRWDNEFNNMME